METLLVRLKPHDPRRGHCLRRYTYRGIKFQEERGWYRVDKSVADYLREVRQVATDEHAPLAFDVCTADEAKTLDAKEKDAVTPRKTADDDIKLSEARGDGAMTTSDLPEDSKPATGTARGSSKKGRGK
ncbi:MAG: hypothetical protein CSB49_04960 [Proteobacteria bacterium]|nr:MAG: hypothetical protein CSB49_04960 [Pseudomonadota bacterium]